ncbi:MAG: hypothetical protein GY943_20050 [Chloroflexi bacterium]|nr:hypothetical protein [Chloroflexota bacterium]
MKLSTFDESCQFELHILKYEFPHIKSDKYDANWLIIEVFASNRSGNFHGKDPCLFTWEVNRLADWFENISKENEVNHQLSFMEPALKFHLITGVNKSKNILRIFVNHRWRDCKLSGAFDDEIHEIWLDFPLSDTDLSRASYQLRKQLKKFPERL